MMNLVSWSLLAEEHDPIIGGKQGQLSEQPPVLLRHPPWCWSQKEDTKVQDQILPSAKSNWVWVSAAPSCLTPNQQAQEGKDLGF